MDIQSIGKYLTARYNQSPCVLSTYYTNIQKWDSYYKGYVEDLHKVTLNNGFKTISRTMACMGMAQQVCQDWSSASYNEDVVITLNTGKDSVNNGKTSAFLQGSNGNGGVFESTNFKTEFSKLLEQVYALGTGAVIVNATSVTVDVTGNLIQSENSKIDMTFVNAMSILPLSSANGKIVECAFISTHIVEDKVYYILQVHKLENGVYVIYNDVVDNSGNPVSLPDLNLVPKIITGRDKPLFTILKTSIVNTIDYNCPLGQSIFHGAIGILRAIDLVMDSYVVEFIVGQKLVFMDKRLFSKDDKGNLIPPQDAKQYYLQMVGDEVVFGQEKAVIHEYNPELRIPEHDLAIQKFLDILAMKVGLGIGAYNLTATSSPTTATQYVGQRNDFVRNLKKNSHMVEQALKSIVKSILWVGANMLGSNVVAECGVSIELPDGVVEDDATEKASDRQDVKDGLMLPWEFRMKWYGESEEVAKAKIEEVKKTANTNNTNTQTPPILNT